MCAECMKTCCLGGKNSVVKGLIPAKLEAYGVRDKLMFLEDVQRAKMGYGDKGVPKG